MVFPAVSTARALAVQRHRRCVCFMKNGGRGGRTRTLACWNQNPVPLPTWRLPYSGPLCSLRCTGDPKNVAGCAFTDRAGARSDSNRCTSQAMDEHPCCRILEPSSRPAHRRGPLPAAVAQTPRFPSPSSGLADHGLTTSQDIAPHQGTGSVPPVAGRCARTPGFSEDRRRCALHFPVAQIWRLQQSLEV